MFVWLVLSVCQLTTNVHKIFGRAKYRDKEELIRFWGDLHSDLDPRILFLLPLFAV